MQQPAVFLDRDGVLIEDTHLVTSMEQVAPYPRVKNDLLRLKAHGFRLFLITNQAVVARGMIEHEAAKRLNREILSRCLECAEVDDVFDAIYLCPHHPKATRPEFRVDCSFRKPKTGMLEAAQKEFNIDFSRSFLIGDRVSDIACGNAVRVKTIQVLTGQHQSPMIEAVGLGHANTEAMFRAKTLSEAVEIICNECQVGGVS